MEKKRSGRGKNDKSRRGVEGRGEVASVKVKEKWRGRVSAPIIS